jgi:hypothetical protein
MFGAEDSRFLGLPDNLALIAQQLPCLRLLQQPLECKELTTRRRNQND